MTALAIQKPTALDTTCDAASSRATDGYFAFARIKGDFCLVQASSSTHYSALTAVEVKVFRHEFISIFRLVERLTLHPSDICILEPIDQNLTRYEEDSETVFLARNVMQRMRNLIEPWKHFTAISTHRQPYPPKFKQ